MDSSPAQKLNIQNILTNDYLSPYSLQEFYNYTQQQKCEELVEFWRAVNNYQRKCRYADAMIARQASANTDVVPDFHHRTSIFAYDNIDGQVEEKLITRVPTRKSKESQSLFKKITSWSEKPNSKNSPRKRAASDPQSVREEVPVEVSLAKVPESLTSSLTMLNKKADQLGRDSKFDSEIKDLISVFIKQGAVKEVNIPSVITRKMMRDFELGVRGVPLFQATLEHVELVLTTSCLPGFLKYASSLPGSAVVVARPKVEDMYQEKDDGLQLVKKMAPK